MTNEMTIGEHRVRKSFNPNENPDVKFVKEKMAELIDYCHKNSNKDPRLAAIAMTELEGAAMWMVKLVTA